jgi:hypothetical protein
VVEAKAGRILVRRALSEREVLPPKSGDEREVPLAPELETVLVPLMKDKQAAARAGHPEPRGAHAAPPAPADGAQKPAS